MVGLRKNRARRSWTADARSAPQAAQQPAAPMQRAGMKSGAMAWAKASSLCDLCGPAGCDHTHAPTGLEQSLEQMEFTRSACNAAHVGEVARLTRMIERNSGCVHHDGTSDRTGYTPLHYAARGGHVECVALLLRSGASVLARTSAGGATPLHRAAFAGRTEVCTMLVRAGAQVDAQDADGETALHKAASQGHAQVLAALETACPAAVPLVNRQGRRAAELVKPRDG